MKKSKSKILSALLFALLIVPCMLIVTACGEEHKALEKWECDATYHWHNCSVKDCKEHTEEKAFDYAKHTYDAKTHLCVCGAGDHKATETYGKDDTQHWFTCQIEGCDEKFNVAGHVYDEGTHKCVCKAVDPDVVASITTGEEESTTTTYYLTLAEAIKQANSKSEIVLCKDVTISKTLCITKDLTIRSAKNYSISAVTENFEQDSSITEKSEINKFIYVKGCSLGLYGVTINANQQGRAIYVSGGSLTLDDTVVTGGYVNNHSRYGIFMTGKSTFTMWSGTITGHTYVRTDWTDSSKGIPFDYIYSTDLWIGSEVVAIIKAGTIGNLFVNSNDFSKADAMTTINGGTINNVYVEYEYKNNTEYKAKVDYKGGTISNLLLSTTTNGTWTTIENPAYGTYIGGGTYVSTDENDNEVTTQYVSTFAELTSAIGDTNVETVVLAANITATKLSNTEYGVDNVIVNRKVTLDLNGKTLKGSGYGGVLRVVVGGDLTINDSSEKHTGSVVANGVWGDITGGKGYRAMAVWARGGNVTINGGNYSNTIAETSNRAYNDLIYASNAEDTANNNSLTIGGHVSIYGGYFESVTSGWVLNINNSHRTQSSITVYGGTYKNFDPSSQKGYDTLTSGEDEAKVNRANGDADSSCTIATGYKVSATTVNGVKLYTVAQSTETVTPTDGENTVSQG